MKCNYFKYFPLKIPQEQVHFPNANYIVLHETTNFQRSETVQTILYDGDKLYTISINKKGHKNRHAEATGMMTCNKKCNYACFMNIHVGQ